MHRMTLWCALALALAPVACSNPAADTPEAIVTDPAPAPEPTATPDAAADPAAEPAAATDPAPTAPTLALTPESGTIGFIGSKVTGSHEGGFKEFRGTLELTPEGDAIRALSAVIDMNSTWSDNDKLTEHLKNADFFDVPRFPEATFTSTAITPGGADGATHTVTGNLTLHGVTKSITFPATLKVSATEAIVDSEFFLRRKDFGIEYSGRSDDLIRDEVVIKLALRSPRG